MAMTIEQANARRAEGRRRQLAERKSLGVSPVDGRFLQNDPAPNLPTLRLDAKVLRCQRGCGAVAFLDRETIMMCRAQRARWICAVGHDGWVRLEGVVYDEGSGRTFVRGKHFHFPDGTNA